MSNETEVLGSLALEARCEALVRVSRAIGAHPDPKEFFGVLVDELRRIVPCDYICVSLRDKNYLTFQNYCVEMASRSAVVSEETLMLEDSFTLSVYERQELLQRSTDEMDPQYGRLQAHLERLHI